MESTKRLKWGIMGPGIVASNMANALIESPNNQLSAVASKTQSKAKAFAEKFGVKNAYSYQEIVNDSEIDIIYVATIHNFHFKNAKYALEHGKHVLIEKPFTVNADEARELVRIAGEKNLFLMEAMWIRFIPSVLKLKERVVNGDIGEVKQINISYGSIVGPVYEERLKTLSLAGGVTLDMGIYAISFVCYLLGEIPTDIKSMSRFSDTGVDEIADYMFRFPSGCLVNICTSYNLKMRSEAILYGTRGYIEFPEFSAGPGFTINIHEGTNKVEESVYIPGNNHVNRFIYQVEEVTRCIRAGETESRIIPLHESISIMKVIDEMRKDWDFVYPFE
ncbi:MAG: Gfo/Idh/MocA family oxidoreductase [Candidatus Marinimicrobia bacterium]|nr:Gfo/Idh/MocA family oxidoreductase [Candidatus Neomarinimicrobiota bacterium]